MRYRMELLDNDFSEVRNVEMDIVLGGVSLRCDPNSPDPNNLALTGCVVINKDAKEIATIMARSARPELSETGPCGRRASRGAERVCRLHGTGKGARAAAG